VLCAHVGPRHGGEDLGDLVAGECVGAAQLVRGRGMTRRVVEHSGRDLGDVV
jgi:hypothetical protein